MSCSPFRLRCISSKESASFFVNSSYEEHKRELSYLEIFIAWSIKSNPRIGNKNLFYFIILLPKWANYILTLGDNSDMSNEVSACLLQWGAQAELWAGGVQGNRNLFSQLF